MTHRWVIAAHQPSQAQKLASTLDISPLLAQCLINRGLTEEESVSPFLEPRLQTLSDPFELPGMKAAVERLWAARQQGEPVVLFGDYDVDGVTSVALLKELLQDLGWTVHCYVPKRFGEGYGLSPDGAANCLAEHPTRLILAVDCGSTARAAIDWLKEQGVDVIVLDHHQAAEPARSAKAMVNPHLDEGADPRWKTLCSAGLSFKLAHALVKHGRKQSCEACQKTDIRGFLDLVALGTIADLVPLQGENRILAAQGLKRLDNTRRPGLQALKSVANVNHPAGAYDVGYLLGPRLNAAGRLENAEAALHLLLAKDLEEATPLAMGLDSQNRERQRIEQSITQEAMGTVRARFNPETDFAIVEGAMRWHIGVVGIVASRMVREFYRPTIIIGGQGEEWRGSGRSIEGFDLASALHQCTDLLMKHGGHAMAAGLSIRPRELDAFRRRLNQLAAERLKPEQLKPLLRLDAEVTLDEISYERVCELQRLEPIGQGNPGLQFCARRLRLQRPPQRLGREQKHLKMVVTDGQTTREAIWWNAKKEPAEGVSFQMAFAPRINEFNGNRSVQLQVLDWRVDRR